ncbi:MAG: CAP domain-containing protein, partial [Romboutsia sp.]
INSNNQYDIFNINNKYITVFYDIYENNKVCSYQIIHEDAEKSLVGMYPDESENIKKSFELQTIDLVNSTRIKNNLNALQYSEKATLSSRNHSHDMMKKKYFDHLNKENETPFDRMKNQGIDYMGAGENIAAGQTSAIYAHEAWMNSQGHRKNILGDYKYIGVGVIFGGYYTIYYTQNFYI